MFESVGSLIGQNWHINMSRLLLFSNYGMYKPFLPTTPLQPMSYAHITKPENGTITLNPKINTFDTEVLQDG